MSLLVACFVMIALFWVQVRESSQSMLEVPFVANNGQLTDSRLIFSMLSRSAGEESETLSSYQQAMLKRQEPQAPEKVAVFSVKYLNESGEEISYSPRGKTRADVKVTSIRGKDGSKGSGNLKGDLEAWQELILTFDPQ